MVDKTNQGQNEETDVSRRDFLQRLGAFGALGLGASTLIACGGSEGKNGSSSSATSTSSASKSGQSAGDVAQTVTIHPKGNQMKYEETEFTVPKGKKVKVVLDNTATSPSMQHNVVVLDKAPKQSNFQKVGQAGMSAGSSKEYVPDDMAMILAHTPVATPGETVSVTFTAPDEPGDYGYVCTYPGHWATMQGTMHVK